MRGDSALRYVSLTEAQRDSLIVACALNRQQQAFVRDGLRRSACRFVDTFGELERLLAESLQCDTLILAPEDREGRSATASIRRAIRQWPETAIVALCPSRSEQTPSLQQLVVAGVHKLVFSGMHDTAAELAVAVDMARRECAAERVYREITPLVPSTLHGLVELVLGRPDSVASVAEVSNLLGIHRKTLFNWCTKAGFLQPGELIVWCRLAMVAHFLERSGATIESIALNLGFASHTALRNLIKRYAKRTASEVREQGGLTVLLDAMRERLARHPTKALPLA
jgi:AraC-like DNA-binding protein